MSSRLVSPPLSAHGLRLVENDAVFFALQPFWDGLLERCAVRTPFMTWDWVSLRWEQQRDHCQLCIGVIDDPVTGMPAAIAPLMIGREVTGPRKTLRTLTFIGCLGEAPSQGMDFLVPKGLEQELTPLLCKVFMKTSARWDVIDLPTIHGESASLPLFREALSHFACAGERQPSQTCYVMTLPDTWEQQMEAWKSKERCIYRSKWRRVMDERAGRPLQGGIDLPADHAFDELWRLHSLRFEGEHSLFLNEESKRFHKAKYCCRCWRWMA
jgi:CelD/BcsL family acetyltransferase involved in cellulose biosynthesis